MKILDLSLTYHWYDMIASGEKKEEYRELKSFYWNRLVDLDKFKGCYKGCRDYCHGFKDCIGCGCKSYKYYDAVRFHRGQGGKVSMLVRCNGIKIGKGKPEWGAPEQDVFIISLGEIINDSARA